MNNQKIQKKINSIILDAIKNHTSSANNVAIETQDLKLLFDADKISDLIRDLDKSLDAYFYEYLCDEKELDADYIIRVEKDDELNTQTIEIVHYINDNNNRFHTYIEISQL
jgi:HD superfamily phosphohydrolase YqeK